MSFMSFDYAIRAAEAQLSYQQGMSQNMQSVESQVRETGNRNASSRDKLKRDLIQAEYEANSANISAKYADARATIAMQKESSAKIAAFAIPVAGILGGYLDDALTSPVGKNGVIGQVPESQQIGLNSNDVKSGRLHAFALNTGLGNTQNASQIALGGYNPRDQTFEYFALDKDSGNVTNAVKLSRDEMAQMIKDAPADSLLAPFKQYVDGDNPPTLQKNALGTIDESGKYQAGPLDTALLAAMKVNTNNNDPGAITSKIQQYGNSTSMEAGAGVLAKHLDSAKQLSKDLESAKGLAAELAAKTKDLPEDKKLEAKQKLLNEKGIQDPLKEQILASKEDPIPFEAIQEMMVRNIQPPFDQKLEISILHDAQDGVIVPSSIQNHIFDKGGIKDPLKQDIIESGGPKGSFTGAGVIGAVKKSSEAMKANDKTANFLNDAFKKHGYYVPNSGPAYKSTAESIAGVMQAIKDHETTEGTEINGVKVPDIRTQMQTQLGVDSFSNLEKRVGEGLTNRVGPGNSFMSRVFKPILANVGQFIELAKAWKDLAEEAEQARLQAEQAKEAAANAFKKLGALTAQLESDVTA